MEKSRMALWLTLLLLANGLAVGAINQQYSNNNHYRLGDLIASKLQEFSNRQDLPVGLGIAAIIGIGVAAVAGAVIGSWIYLAANPPAAGPAGAAGATGATGAPGTVSAVSCQAGVTGTGIINRPGLPLLPPPATLADCIATCKRVLGVACGGVSMLDSFCLMHEAPVTAAAVDGTAAGSFQLVSCS